eukprot:10219394-Alexandrium_andersonii.AAC.1
MNVSPTPSSIMDTLSPNRLHEAVTTRLRVVAQLGHLLAHPLYAWAQRVPTPPPVSRTWH